MPFGANDYFALGDTAYEPQSSSIATTASNAQAMDSWGDVACETVFGRAKTWQVVYALVKGATVNVTTKVKLGNIKTIGAEKAVITGVELATTNTDFPRLTVTGEEWFGDTDLRTYTMTGLTAIAAEKRAQPIGVVLDTGTNINGSTASYTVQIVRVSDSVGTFAKSAVYGGRAEASNDLIACSTTAGAVADTANSWALSKEAENATDNTSYGSSTVVAYLNLAND